MADRNEGYAQAVHAVAVAEGKADLVEDELYRFARAYESSDELVDKLNDPHLPAALRQQLVEDVLGDRADPTTTAIVSMVVAAGRARDLPAIAQAVVEQGAAERNREVAEVRTAVPLDEDQIARLASALSEATGREIEVLAIVDPTVLGGVVAQIGDVVIDGSVRHRLSQLREAF